MLLKQAAAAQASIAIHASSTGEVRQLRGATVEGTLESLRAELDAERQLSVAHQQKHERELDAATQRYLKS